MTLRARTSRAVVRLLSIGDLPGDRDDSRLRKRVGVAAGYITIVAPLSLPLEAPRPASTRDLAKGAFAFEERAVDVKGLGPMATFLVVEPKG